MAMLWRSERLVYRGVEPDDDEFIAELSGDSIAYAMSSPSIPVPRNKKVTREEREWLTNSEQVMSTVICLPPPPVSESKTEEKGVDSKTEPTKPKPIPIGVLSLTGGIPIFAHHRHADIGITLAPGYRGQGYGSEAIQYALRWGFNNANLHRIGIGCFSWNEGARRLYERLGFVVESKKRDYFWHEGKYEDLIELSMLEDEWREKYGKQK